MTDKELDRLLTEACHRRSTPPYTPDFSRATSYRCPTPLRFRVLRWTVATGVAAVVAGIIFVRPDKSALPVDDGNLYEEMLGNVETRFQHNKQAAGKMRDDIDKAIPVPSNID